MSSTTQAQPFGLPLVLAFDPILSSYEQSVTKNIKVLLALMTQMNSNYATEEIGPCNTQQGVANQSAATYVETDYTYIPCSVFHELTLSIEYYFDIKELLDTCMSILSSQMYGQMALVNPK